MLKFKENKTPSTQALTQLPIFTNTNFKENEECFVHDLDIPYKPLGSPKNYRTGKFITSIKKPVAPPPIALPGSDLQRAVNFAADYGGCGWWRLGSPELLLNFYQKMIISTLTTMVLDKSFYHSGLCAIKFQRQATPLQSAFSNLLKEAGKQLKFKTIYEVDDVVYAEDIPLYNRCREAFTNPEIRNTVQYIIENCDEMTVVSSYMKEYYKSKGTQKNITVIPNYAPKMWFDRYYNENKLLKEYEKNKKQPRCLITASGTHFDVINAVNQQDDYSKVLQNIIKARKDIKWVFMGGFPMYVKPFIDNGEMEFINWKQLLEFPQAIYESNAQITMAALLNNDFNKSKSDIKFVESGYLGIPFVGQDLEPYKKSFHKFQTGDEMIDQIKNVLVDANTYINSCKKAREYANTCWLDDHLDEHIAIYTTKYGSKEREIQSPNLINLNPEQKVC